MATLPDTMDRAATPNRATPIRMLKTSFPLVTAK